ncbi:MAG: hypothetical protein ACLS7Z_04530 [Christensenellales bacterium]
MRFDGHCVEARAIRRSGARALDETAEQLGNLAEHRTTAHLSLKAKAFMTAGCSTLREMRLKKKARIELKQTDRLFA